MSEVITYNNAFIGYNNSFIGSYDINNPLNLPPYTMRFEFGNGSYDPTQVPGWNTNSSWTRVSSSPNIWDYCLTQSESSYYDRRDWDELFYNKFTASTSGVTKVLGANTSGVRSALALFEGCSSLTEVSLFDTSSVYDTRRMMYGCSSLTSVPLFNLSHVTRIYEMFRGCSSLTSVPAFNTSNVVDDTDKEELFLGQMGFAGMFYGCSSLQSVPLFDISGAYSLQNMFSGCSSLTNVPLFNTSNAVVFTSMFSACSSLTTVPLFNTSKATNMAGMFQSCSSITSLPLFDTQNVTGNQYASGFDSMCANCTALTSVPLFNTSKAVQMSYMFYNCVNVASGAYSLYLQASTQSVVPQYHYQCFGNCGNNTTTGRADLNRIPSSWK